MLDYEPQTVISVLLCVFYCTYSLLQYTGDELRYNYVTHTFLFAGRFLDKVALHKDYRSEQTPWWLCGNEEEGYLTFSVLQHEIYVEFR